MNVNDLMFSPGPAIYYDEDFRNVIEDHISALLRDSRTISISIDSAMAYKYEFNLYALLNELQISPFKHWIILRMNGYRSPTEVDRTLEQLYIPDETVLNQIVQSHRSIRKVIWYKKKRE